MSPLLQISGLQAFYGDSHVLHDVDLSLNRGEVVLLLGRNGAGKTTLMKSIMGLVSVRGGVIDYNGANIAGLKPHQIALRGIGLVPEDRRMFAHLTVAENLELGRKKRQDGREDWNLAKVLDIFPALRPLQARKAGALSGGQQQMVAVARTLLGNPELLLLDEPAEGLAPIIVEELARQLKLLRQEGLTMIISEQNLSFARTLGDRAFVLESGCIRYSGTLEQLDRNREEWARYIAF